METETVVETWQVGPLTVCLEVDPEPDNPRDWDNLGTMVCWHGRYRLGDKHQYPIPNSWKGLTTMIERDKGPCLFLPLYLIDHSGLAMRTRDFEDCDPGQWDSGLVGVIYVPLDRMRLEYGVKYIRKALRDRVLGVLEAEVETYSAYLQGNVLGYLIEDADGEHVDSCWGYYPDGDAMDPWDYLRQEATKAAQWCDGERARKAREL